MKPIKQNDLSPEDFRFDPSIGTSLRDRMRDLLDQTVRRPLYKFCYRKLFQGLPYKTELTLPEKGLSSFARRKWINKYTPIKDSRTLILGCGTGWDIGTWLQFKPKEIIAVDLYNFSGCWQKIKRYVSENNLQTKISFYQTDITELDKFQFDKFDIISSDAVFEHCRDLRQVMKVLYNLLNLNGIIYASYGPLWYCWGGDHFSGRGGIENGYNHVLLNITNYRNYYNKYLREPEFELQNGGRFVELDLFSKLSGVEYLNIYEQAGFKIRSLIVEFCANAVNALKDKSLKINLECTFPRLQTEDFILKSHLVILSKT